MPGEDRTIHPSTTPAASATQIIEEKTVGRRLDVWVASQPWGLSRHQAQRLIARGMVRVNDRPRPAGYRLRLGDRVAWPLGIPSDAPTPKIEATSIPLIATYEDEEILVLDKPPGLVVHPGPGHPGRTLANALVARYGPALADVGGPGRCGLVHRLDQHTSGLLLVAKTGPAHETLTTALAERRIQRRYVAVVMGAPQAAQGEIERPIGRRRRDRQRMGVVAGGRPARTDYCVLARTGGLALLLVRLHTGRTHQIRAHFQSIGHPVAGDPVYGWTRRRSLAALTPELRSALGPIWPRRPMLHAAGLSFAHPGDERRILLTAAPPTDMAGFIQRVFGWSGTDLQRQLRSALGED